MTNEKCVFDIPLDQLVRTIRMFSFPMNEPLDEMQLHNFKHTTKRNKESFTTANL